MNVQINDSGYRKAEKETNASTYHEVVIIENAQGKEIRWMGRVGTATWRKRREDESTKAPQGAASPAAKREFFGPLGQGKSPTQIIIGSTHVP